MKTFETYQEAKIANQEYAIFERDGLFGTDMSMVDYFNIHICNFKECNPADYCMTVAEFEDSGKRLVDGDLYINLDGNVIPYIEGYGLGVDRNPSRNKSRYVLSAKALGEANTIPTETPEEKEALDEKTYRYEKVEFGEDWEYFKLMSEDGDLYVNCVDSTFEGCYGDNINLANAIHEGVDLYRRIEVTERELFIAEFNKTTDEHFAFDVSHVAGKLFDAGCRFVNGKG